MEKYRKYTIVDFLKDESFLSGVLLESEEDIFFWKKFVSENPEKAKAIGRAKQILLSMEFNNMSFTEGEKVEMLEQINKSIAVLKRKKQHVNLFRGAAAACIVALLSFASVCIFNFLSEEPVVAEQDKTKRIESKNTRLILAGQETIEFDDEADIKYQDGGKVIRSANKEIAVLNPDKNKDKYNELIVPKGKRASFMLEDGSTVWVNSGTTLQFPVSFAADRREIIVEGEIYIEITKDVQRPFFVRTSEMDIKVLGTRFNVSAYKEDAEQSVVLVEGLVEVQSKDETKKKILLPDHKLTLTSNEIKISKANTYDYISWKDGLLQFRSQPLSVILSKLSRYYDINIDCEPDIKEMKCTGKLVLFDEWQDVLETISRTIPLEKTISNNVPVTYEITGQSVYIRKK